MSWKFPQGSEVFVLKNMLELARKEDGMACEEDELASTMDLWLIGTKHVLIKDCTSEVQKKENVDCDEVKNISRS